MAIRRGDDSIRDIFGDKGVRLGPVEVRILDALLGRERIVYMDEIMEHVWGEDEEGGPLTGAENVRVIMCNIRKKLAKSCIPWRIVSHQCSRFQLKYLKD